MAYALGTLDPAEALERAHALLVDAQLVLRRGPDWNQLDERDRRLLAGPLGSTARAMGDCELAAAELAAIRRVDVVVAA